MNRVAQETLREAAAGSSEGRLHFGQVVGPMMQVGVESYFADYRARRTTYYLPDGDHLSLNLEMPEVAIGQDFDAEAVNATIRGAQQGTVMYPEFTRLTTRAGCIGYMVWIAGRQVTYFGRKGETQVEHFPD